MLGASATHKAFIAYRQRFKEITRWAQSHFADRNWQAMRASAARRPALYREAIDHVGHGVRQLLADRVQDKWIWTGAEVSQVSSRAA